MTHTFDQQTIRSWLVIGILLIGAWSRLYLLPQTAIFQGDQGRDGIIVHRLLTENDLPLIGPVTSVGNMYLGPLYYYFMAPWQWLTYPQPLGPVYGVALVSIFSVYLLYLVGKELFGIRVGILAMAMYAVMPVAVAASRFSWNPNLQPLLTLVVLWALVRMVRRRTPAYLVVATLGWAIQIQLHYMALILGGLLVLSWVYVWIKTPEARRSCWLYGGLSIGLLFLSWSSLIVFDLTHDNVIFNGFYRFFTGQERHLETISRLWLVLKEMDGRAVRLLTQLFGFDSWTLPRLFTYLSVLLYGYLVSSGTIRLVKDPAHWLLLTGLLLTIIGSSFYNGSLFDHYLLFALPLAVYYWSILLDGVWQKGKVGAGCVIIVICIYGSFSWWRSPIFDEPGPTIAYYQRVTQALMPYLNPPYNLALISENKDFKGMNYRYFLTVSPQPPERDDTYSGLNQLVVIDELSTNNPLLLKNFEIRQPQLSRLVQIIPIPEGPEVFLYESGSSE